ncbi:peptide-methionine (S)-S-oxide reductase MsrA [Marinagarivorans algicola]|uniref:peptide-methionine (S)-S-oxide reductase MsrA n=1 Tax=Marinagarivorans algicola TaxID=1513270 RepID=UPI0006B5E44E|nr:peptide-methionine (S)-S-oxide reductase MsrA [Marinagarivorans algicola]
MLVDSQKDAILYGDTALPGREEAITGFEPHAVLGTPIEPPYPPHYERAIFGMGCFWGAEKLFWQVKGVHTTAVGYGAGVTPNPLYKEVCSGLTGHNELVVIVYNPKKIWYRDLLQLFWENHNPTQGLRQGNDVGPQYRSGIYPLTPEQHFLAKQSFDLYRMKLKSCPDPVALTTEIVNNPPFYFAEEYHQQYLVKNPDGYCDMQNLTVTGLPRFP